MKPDAALETDRLLRHADWVRALAGALLRDPAAADDAAQDAWVAALEHGPRDEGRERAWFATVVRNVARRMNRGERHRRAREEAVARPEAEPPTSSVVERAERQRELAGYALELEEPYRTAVLLRYWEGLPPREIARRLGCSVATVRTRLERAKATLRRKLEQRYGDRAAWAAAFGPLVPRAAVVATAAGVGAALATWWPQAAVVTLGAVGAWWWGHERTPGTPARTSAHDARTALLERPEPDTRGPEVGDEDWRAPLASEERSSGAAVGSETGPSETLRGRLVDLAGRALPDLTVRWERYSVDRGDRIWHSPPEAPPFTAVTAADGGFLLRHPEPRGGFRVATDDGWTVVARATAPEPLYVAARTVAASGIVRDEAGVPLEEVRFTRKVNPQALGGFSLDVEWSWEFDLLWLSDESGRFELEHAPALDAGQQRIAVSCEGFEGIEALDLPDTPSAELDLVLRARSETPTRLVSGLVFDGDGRPAAGATVRFGTAYATAAYDGSFSMSVTGRPNADPCAELDGWVPGRALGFADRFVGSAGDVLGLTLSLGPRPLALEGVVRDCDGRPLAGWRVDVAGDEGWPGVALVSTDEGGRFRLEGLLAQSYRPWAYDPETFRSILGDPVPAGRDDVELRLPGDTLHAVVRGRVVSAGGLPMPDLEIWILLDTSENGIWGRFVGRADASGRFELQRIPRERVSLRAEGPLAEGNEVPIESLHAGEELVLPVLASARFRIVLAEDDPAESFALVSESGQPMRPSVFVPDGTNSRTRVQRGAEKERDFPVCNATEDAAWVVLYAGDTELRRVPISLVPGALELQILEL